MYQLGFEYRIRNSQMGVYTSLQHSFQIQATVNNKSTDKVDCPVFNASHLSDIFRGRINRTVVGLYQTEDVNFRTGILYATYSRISKIDDRLWIFQLIY